MSEALALSRPGDGVDRVALHAGQRWALRAVSRAAAPPVSSPTMPPPARTPAGWYPDVEDDGCDRWWDGRAWTDYVQDTGSVPDPATGPGSAEPPATGDDDRPSPVQGSRSSDGHHLDPPAALPRWRTRDW